MNMRQTVEFDIALALQLCSQNVSLIVVTIGGIDAVTWNIIKVVAELNCAPNLSGKKQLTIIITYLLVKHGMSFRTPPTFF